MRDISGTIDFTTIKGNLQWQEDMAYLVREQKRQSAYMQTVKETLAQEQTEMERMSMNMVHLCNANMMLATYMQHMMEAIAALHLKVDVQENRQQKECAELGLLIDQYEFLALVKGTDR